jgi:hypothetical protein
VSLKHNTRRLAAACFKAGALCPGPAHQRNYFFQFNQALCALRE